MSTLTIGIPVFNDAKFLEESLKSLFNQTFQDFTLIISDDCSTDETPELCKRYSQMDGRIRYIRQTAHLGLAKNLTFLLQQADTKYFMWAAADDVWANNFVEKLIGALEGSNDACVAFCTFSWIDERGNVLEKNIDFDFGNESTFLRLKKLLEHTDDTFGYGMFVTDRIRDVEFPVWWWPNSQCAYNSIYPSLCFYLSKGNYIHVYGDSLFFKRRKNKENQHHQIPYPPNEIKALLAYYFRRLNLVFFSLRMIRKGGNWFLSVLSSPVVFYYWFLIASLKQTSSFWRRKKGLRALHAQNS